MNGDHLRVGKKNQKNQNNQNNGGGLTARGLADALAGLSTPVVEEEGTVGYVVTWRTDPSNTHATIVKGGASIRPDGAAHTHAIITHPPSACGYKLGPSELDESEANTDTEKGDKGDKGARDEKEQKEGQYKDQKDEKEQYDSDSLDLLAIGFTCVKLLYVTDVNSYNGMVITEWL